MSFFFRHKFLSIFIILAISYWYYNPTKKFGIVNKFLIVYNRIPVTDFDFYVNSSGNIFFEDDLTLKTSLQYWYNNHIDKENSGTKQVKLFIGAGFEKTAFSIDREILNGLQKHKFFIRQAPIPDAIKQFNSSVDSGFSSAILIVHK